MINLKHEGMWSESEGVANILRIPIQTYPNDSLALVVSSKYDAKHEVITYR